MDMISDAAEGWLRALEDEFYLELCNHMIHSKHVRYASASEAQMAMLRQAYLRGREDALTPPIDSETFTQQVEATNAKARVR